MTRIVLYDDSKLRSSARAYFISRIFGLKNVAILDGGLRQMAGGGPSGRNRHLGPPFILADFTVAQKTIASGSAAKPKYSPISPAERNRSLMPATPRGFPGRPQIQLHNLAGGPYSRRAQPAPSRRFCTKIAHLSAVMILRSVFKAAGVDLSAPVTGTCGGGVTAAVLLFALHLLGKTNAALYDGSWSEWGADPDTPKETGPSCCMSARIRRRPAQVTRPGSSPAGARNGPAPWSIRPSGAPARIFIRMSPR